MALDDERLDLAPVDALIDVGSNIVSPLVIVGITRVPPGPSALRRASISPSGPPSIGPTVRKDVWTTTMPPSRTPRVRSWAEMSPRTMVLDSMRTVDPGWSWLRDHRG
jgi:hypothetical protein